MQAVAFNGINAVSGQGKQVLILLFSIIARFHITRSHLVLPPRNPIRQSQTRKKESIRNFWCYGSTKQINNIETDNKSFEYERKKMKAESADSSKACRKAVSLAVDFEL